MFLNANHNSRLHISKEIYSSPKKKKKGGDIWYITHMLNTWLFLHVLTVKIGWGLQNLVPNGLLKNSLCIKCYESDKE